MSLCTVCYRQRQAFSRGLLLPLAQDQVGELKILALEARNHLYAVLKDTEVWQEALQSKCH